MAIMIECPPGHVAVYNHYFEFGLRFPLDSFLLKILNAFNVCLSQLTSLANRKLIVYIWTIQFSEFLETLSLFRHLYWLKKNDYARYPGWWSLSAADNRLMI